MIVCVQSDEVIPDLPVLCSLIDKKQMPGKQLFQDLNKHVASASCTQPVAVGLRIDGWFLHFSLCSIMSLYITVVVFVFSFFFIHNTYLNLCLSFILQSIG